MTQFACIRCAEPIDDSCWCATCDDHTAAVEVLEPEPIGWPQYYAICRWFVSRGIVNRAERMRRLSRHTGRVITDYWQLTTREADTLIEEWAHGH